MLRAIECAEGLLVSFGATCRVRCPEHGRVDECAVQISYRTRKHSAEAISLRDYLASFADKRLYAEELAEEIQAAIEISLNTPAMVTVAHSTEGVTLNVTAGRV